MTRQLDLSTVFDRTPLKRATLMAVVLFTSVLCLTVTNSSAMERWIAGYLNLKDGYWQRETELILKVITQPGDRIRDFIHNQHKHPKGSDLSVMIEVPPGKKPPDQVRFEARLANGRGIVRAYLTRTGDQPFRHTIPSLLDDAEIWITGGDYVNLRPYRVRVVQPPEVQSVVLNCLYPEYTGLNQRLSGEIVRTVQQVNGAQASLPLSTDFLLQITANKPLVRMRLEGDAGQERWEIEFHSAGTDIAKSPNQNPSSRDVEVAIVLRSNEGRPEIRIPFTEEMIAKCWPDTRDTISIPFVLAADGASKLPELLQRAGESNEGLSFPLPLPPDSPLRIVLEDADDILSTTPARFTINGIVDEPPIVTTELRGIGASITRRARIPISGLLADDYGVVSARFDYKVDDADGWLPRRFQSPPEKSLREFRLNRSDAESFERFDVQPLDLSVKQSLLVTVAAVDGCTVGSAHVAQGQKYSFTIVSDEELLSMLYTREINIRKRFEQIIEELKQTRQLLNQQQDKLGEADTLKKQGIKPNDDKLQVIEQGLNVSADRLLQSIRKNSVETLGVQTSFEDIREELVNNAADTPQLLERLDD
ncbi:MAG: hypothetical protein FJ267_08665, partial [Planctomycetes bacterium]|nr:hypothetical protein [Planctomycetota bacterium]